MQSIKKRLAQFAPSQDRDALLQAIKSLYDTQVLKPPAMGIQGGSAAATFTTGNAVVYLLKGVPIYKATAATQSVPTALSWTGVASTYNAGGLLVTLDSAGTVATLPTAVTTTTLSQAAAIAAIKWPEVSENVCVIGGFIVSTSSANTTFTGGTTNLDASGIQTDFFNIHGPFFPAAAL